MLEVCIQMSSVLSPLKLEFLGQTERFEQLAAWHGAGLRVSIRSMLIEHVTRIDSLSQMSFMNSICRSCEAHCMRRVYPSTNIWAVSQNCGVGWG
jgi:hypothetical protein